MIPDIGLMIGCYILTRMTVLLSRKGERAESLAARVMAVLTVLVVLVVLVALADLLLTGQSLPSA